MAATFRTRPWLLASSARPAVLPAFNTSRILMANMQQSRHAASRSKKMAPSFRSSIKSTKKQQNLQEATSSLAHGMIQEQNAMNPAESALLAPQTLIPLPLSKIQGWNRRFSYYKEIFMQRVVDRFQILTQTWSLKKTRFSFAKFRAKRKGVVEDALRLHAEMSQCLAKGGPAERARLAQICVPKLQRSLVAVIDARPRGKSYTWERIETKGKPFWPRLVDHKWMDVDVGFKQSYRQAVVGIKSRQRLTEIGANGKERESKEMDLMEYVVMWRLVDKANLTQGDWKLYGTLKETTFDDVVREKDMMKKMADLMAQKKVAEEEKKLKQQ